MAPFSKQPFLKKLRTTFLAGLLLIIPIVGSVFIILKLFHIVDRALPGIMGARWFPGIGFVVTLVTIYLIGLLAKNWFGRKIITTGNSIIISIPLLSKFYIVLKQIIDTVTRDKNKTFSKTVIVEYPRKDSYAIGFITSEHNAEFSAKAGRKLLSVFVPTSPNPTSGFLLYIPEEDMIMLDIPVESAFKLIVSAGLTGADKSENQTQKQFTTEHTENTEGSHSA